MKCKKITKAGGITLPKEIRAELGLPAGAPVDLRVEEHSLRISKHVPVCFNCGETAGVLEVMGVEICEGCARKLMEAFGNE